MIGINIAIRKPIPAEIIYSIVPPFKILLLTASTNLCINQKEQEVPAPDIIANTIFIIANVGT